jgi:hypothetical protein
MYLSAFRNVWTIGVAAAADSEQLQIVGIASILVTTVLLVGPMVMALNRWRTPAHTFTILFGAVAVLLTGLDSFRYAALAVPAVIAGVVADLLVARGAGSRVVASVAPLVLWTGFFATQAITWRVMWPVNVWVGSIALATLTGYGLAQLGSHSR